MTGFRQDDSGVDVALSGGSSLRAQYLVGCDGGRSVVRKAAGIEFAGWDPTTWWIIAEVEMEEVPEFGLRGGGGIGPAEDGRVGVTLIEPDANRTDEPTLEDLRAALIRVDGTDHGVHSPRFISRFTDMTRQAVEYRNGRVLVAGDAAHVHPPMGGQGLNIGVQDSVNLGWKLAQVVSGTSPVTLLDTYQDERHPVGARVLHNTMAQRAIGANDERTVALRDILAELLTMDQPRKHVAGMISGLDVAYDLGEGHPLVGRRMPDLDLKTPRGQLRVYELLHSAKPVLLNFGEPGEPRWARYRTVGRPRPVPRRVVRRHLGAPGARRGHRSPRRLDPTRRPCRLGGRPRRPGAPRGADHLVRTAYDRGIARGTLISGSRRPP